LIIFESKKTLETRALKQILDFSRYQKLLYKLSLHGYFFSNVYVIALHDGRADLVRDVSSTKQEFPVTSEFISHGIQITVVADMYVPLYRLYKSMTRGLALHPGVLLTGYLKLS